MAADGCPLILSVRFSEVTSLFVDKLFSASIKAGTPLSKIVLELSEIRESNLTPDLINNLRMLRRVGVNLAMRKTSRLVTPDKVITQLPLNIVSYTKAAIDPSGGSREEKMAALQAHKKAGVSVAMDGVDFVGEWQAARSLGVDFCQGEFVCPSVTKSQLMRWFAGWKKVSVILCA